MIKTIYCWSFIAILTTAFGTMGVIMSIVTPDYVIKLIIRPWAYCITKVCRVKVHTEGFENFPEGPCVIMYNHQSSFDILAFCGFLPIEWRAMMKNEVAKIPFVGWVPKLLGHYFVARDGTVKDSSEVKRIVRQIKSGPAVLVAPEGTRSADGNLLPFKMGGFAIAMLAGIPVVSMAITGGKNIMAKGSLKIKSGSMKIKVFPPIDVMKLQKGKKGREELAEMVRKQLQEAINQEEK